MNVKVNAKVSIYDDYDYDEIVRIYYRYKAEGFKKSSGYINIIIKHHNETDSDYNKRLLKELRLLTKEEVIEKVKNAIIGNLKYKIACSTLEEEKNRLLKELNNIKFNFTIKDKL